MTLPSPAADDLVSEVTGLVMACLSGDAGRDDAARLDELLRNSDEACRVYIRVVLDSSSLRRWGATERPSPEEMLDPQQLLALAASCLDIADHNADDSSCGRRRFSFPGVLGNVLHGTVGYVSSGWPAAYLVATVILGIGLVVGALVHVSRPVQVARQSAPLGASNPQSLIPNPSPKAPLVGRITGMVDCRWEGSVVSGQWPVVSGQTAIHYPPSTIHSSSHQSLATSHFVSLGDTFALASGLLEITYHTGAKVILQGPVTYKVESATGGFLSVGKLTARVEKKVASGQWPVASKSEMSSLTTSHWPLATNTDPQSLIPNPSSLPTIHYPLFTVRTPTATVTDLGTEFGVEVDRDGTNRVYVFQGRVEFRDGAKAGRTVEPMVLDQGQAVSMNTNGRVVSPSAIEAPRVAAAFIRHLPRASACVDLLDIVAGGNGSGTHRRRGINPADGAIASAFVSTLRPGDNRYLPAPSCPLIDGVFVPNGGAGPVQLDSAGHLFDGFPKTEGTTLGTIWARDAKGQPDGQTQKRRHWICAMGRGERYMPRSRGLLCLHPNAGITFDLAEIRKTRQEGTPVRFHAVAGMAGRGMADVWVFVDGQLKFQRLRLRTEDGRVNLGVILTPADHFLTLVSTDGGNGADYDWLVLGDPVLQMAPQMEEPL